MTIGKLRHQFGQPFGFGLGIGGQIAAPIGLGSPAMGPLVRVGVEDRHVSALSGERSAEGDDGECLAYSTLAAGERDDRHVGDSALVWV
jgi:hypothetical protein